MSDADRTKYNKDLSWIRKREEKQMGRNKQGSNQYLREAKKREEAIRKSEAEKRAAEFQNRK